MTTMAATVEVSGVTPEEPTAPDQDRQHQNGDPRQSPRPWATQDQRLTSSSWREHALTRARELRSLLQGCDTAGSPAHQRIAQFAAEHIEDAESAARNSPRPFGWINGSAVERTMSNLDAAEADLLRLASPDYLTGQLPGVLAHVRRHLAAADPRRIVVEDLARELKAAPGPRRRMTVSEKDAVIAAHRAASSAGRREILRLRSFRNVLLVSAAVLAIVTCVLAVVGATYPNAVPLCFVPDGVRVVCPTQEAVLSDTALVAPGAAATEAQVRDVDDTIMKTTRPWDIPLVLAVGLIAASISAAAALRGIKGTSTPYSLPVALAVLKLPTGALTAFLGLLLMRGQFVPGLSALDFPAQIIAWAVVFGYAQQLFTRMVDQQAQDVLGDVGESPSKAAV